MSRPPNIGLPNGAPGGDCLILTFDQSASSSSAKMSGSEVITPWPISDDGLMMVMMSSVPMVTQALGAAGRMTRGQAVKKLEAMEEGWEEKKNGRRAQGAAAYITNNPLYQQTIKDCLSDDAYSDYRTRQVERLAFRQQALRDLVVAGLDTRLLLSHQQRQRFAETAAKLSAPKSGNVAGGIMLAQVVKQIDQGDLSDWQRGEFNSILRGRAKWKK